MSKLLPHFLSVALVIWIYGGTLWYQKNFCCSPPSERKELNTTTSGSHSTLQDATQLSLLPHEGRVQLVSNKMTVQPLNLYFQHKKFQFSETLDLETYFSNLYNFLKQNNSYNISISAFSSKTEGGDLAKKRLDYIREYLYNKNFPLDRILFENRGLRNRKTTNDGKLLKNQLIEIRFITP